MKTHIEPTPKVASRRGLNTRIAVASLALMAAAIPVLADHRSGASTKEDPNAIRPFRVNVPKAALTDLRRRLEATRWPTKELVTDRSQGVQLATLKELVRYWAKDYDWRKAEAKLNAFPQFVTKIDGVDIHFIHVKSRHPDAMPLIMTHGWPGSVIEMLETIGPLTDPTAYGGTLRVRAARGVQITSWRQSDCAESLTAGGACRTGMCGRVRNHLQQKAQAKI